MKIGIDNLDLVLQSDDIDLSKYKDLNEKYVHAVDNSVDILITDNEETAKYFFSSGITSFVEFKEDLS